MAKKTEDLIKMDIDELKKRLVLLREDIRVLHFKAEGSKSKNVKEAKALRKLVAQVLTEINKKNKKK
jgi:ribosomal protein L29